MKSIRIKLWDLPTRSFHWLLASLISAALVSGYLGGGFIEWHGKIGLAIVGLIVFRLVWGLIGSTYARFANFFPTPSSIKAYLSGKWHGIGHNPLGAFSVFGLLLLIALQAGSGLFSNDDIAFQGPLANLINKDLSNAFTGAHKLMVYALLALILLHLAAIIFYQLVKKEDLVKPMIFGWKSIKAVEPTLHQDQEKNPPPASAQGGGLVALIIALSIAGAAVYAASGAWQAAPQPAAEVAPAPDW